MHKGTIYSISVSPERGQLKKDVLEANVIENYGIENDGHAGDWNRQITCLNWASVQKVKRRNILRLERDAGIIRICLKHFRETISN